MSFWDSAKTAGKKIVQYEANEVQNKLRTIEKYKERYERYDNHELIEIARKDSTPGLAKMAIKQILVDRGAM